MAITTDTGAKKIAGTDNWRDIFDDHNDTVDAYDSNIASITDGLAIMANGNTHAAIAAGQAVYVRNHSTLADGLYWANTAIATNGTLSTSNLTADASGGLNKLKGDIDSLNSKISNNYINLLQMGFITLTSSAPANTNINMAQLRFDKNWCQIDISFTNANGFQTGEMSEIAKINFNSVGIVPAMDVNTIGSVNGNAEYPTYSSAQGFSWWRIDTNGNVIVRVSTTGMKAVKLSTVFKLGW